MSDYYVISRLIQCNQSFSKISFSFSLMSKSSSLLLKWKILKPSSLFSSFEIINVCEIVLIDRTIFFYFAFVFVFVFAFAFVFVFAFAIFAILCKLKCEFNRFRFLLVCNVFSNSFSSCFDVSFNKFEVWKISLCEVDRFFFLLSSFDLFCFEILKFFFSFKFCWIRWYLSKRHVFHVRKTKKASATLYDCSIHWRVRWFHLRKTKKTNEISYDCFRQINHRTNDFRCSISHLKFRTF